MSPEIKARAKPSKRPRYRYVLIEVRRPVGLTRGRIIEALRRAVPSGFESGLWLTRFDGRHGILRCLRGTEKEWVSRLPGALAPQGIEIETLSTSGSIAALERRHRNVHLPQGVH